MKSEWFADLDELVLRCRNEQAAEFIAEAVGCYRAGAFRSCIVATWTAVVYDFLQKLHELELTGDAKARAHLERFEKTRGDANIPAALVFERNVLNMARNDFEFLSPLEYEDLVRLLDDRNRCAHPSMNSSEEPYRASPELARYHLRNAVTHMLQHEPVQGKAALERLCNEVFSDYFPVHDVDAAITHFKQGPLARPRAALVRNFVTILIKALLLDPDKIESQYKLATALEAVRTLHRGTAEPVIYEKINDMMRSVADESLSRSVTFLYLVSDIWGRLAADVQSRLRTYVVNMPDTDLDACLVFALSMDPLDQQAIRRLSKITSLQMLVEMAEEMPVPGLVQRSVELYLQSDSFAEARKNTWLLARIVRFLRPSQIEQLIAGVSKNNQITGSRDFPWLIRHIRDSEILADAQLDDLLDKYDFQRVREGLFHKEADENGITL